MKKKFNTESITNELKGSLFFQRPKQDKPEVPTPPSQTVQETSRTIQDNPKSPVDQANHPTSTAQDTPPERSNARTAVRRPTRRYAFEMYVDQIEALRARSLQDQLAGGGTTGGGTMSRMVREAIDQYLAALEKERN